MKALHRSKIFWALVVVALALVVVRLMLPFWVRDYVNRRLSELKDFRGHVEDVDLALWRGAYQIRGIKIVKTSGDVPVPLFSAPLIDLSVTNSEKLSKTLHAHVEMEARPLRSGDLRAKMDLDPYAAKPTFNLETELKDLPLVKLNDFAKAYAAITFEKGTLRLATELNAKNGDFDGYVEPVFEHMSIFNPKHDSDNPIGFVWQAIVGGLTHLVRNHPTDRFGTRVPIHGSFDNPKPAILTTVLNVFRNAIIQVFKGTLPDKELPKVEKNPG